MDAFWIILTGALVGINGALVGSFLLLRRMAMVADAISHAVLPGIVLAFLMAGSRSAPTMLLGAALMGVGTTIMIEWLHSHGRLASDSAIGITFTGLFAVGIILLTALAGSVDLDQDCVLYGEIAYVPIDTYFGAAGTPIGPRAVWHLAPVLVLTLGTVLLAFRPLQLTTFDPIYARSLGYRNQRWHLILMSLTSLITVASFEAVGAILVVAFLVAPAATALLLTRSLPWVLVLASCTAVVAATAGYYLAVWWDASIAGSITVVSGLLFAFAVFLAPKEGLLFRRMPV